MVGADVHWVTVDGVMKENASISGIVYYNTVKATAIHISP
jgi:hypothetical protein